MMQKLSVGILNLVLFVLVLLSPSKAIGQTTKVSGKVSDALTNEPVPFANVAFKGTRIGAVTDINGNFTIETNEPTDSLTASFVGYKAEL